MVEELAKFLGLSFSKPWFKNYECATRAWDDHQLFLLKPLTFMNRSGAALESFFHTHKIGFENLVVFVDQIDLDPGIARLKSKGSSAGHNGLKSIESFLGTQEYKRLYLGIGRPSPSVSVVDHVLQNPGEEDQIRIKNVCTNLTSPLMNLFTTSWDRVIEIVNRKP